MCIYSKGGECLKKETIDKVCVCVRDSVGEGKNLEESLLREWKRVSFTSLE